MKKEHSPLPWEVQEYPSEISIFSEGHGSDVGEIYSIEDAQHIVNCVNNYDRIKEEHAKMLALLLDARSYVNKAMRHPSIGGSGLYESIETLINKIEKEGE